MCGLDAPTVIFQVSNAYYTTSEQLVYTPLPTLSTTLHPCMTYPAVFICECIRPYQLIGIIQLVIYGNIFHIAEKR